MGVHQAAAAAGPRSYGNKETWLQAEDKMFRKLCQSESTSPPQLNQSDLLFVSLLQIPYKSFAHTPGQSTCSWVLPCVWITEGSHKLFKGLMCRCLSFNAPSPFVAVKPFAQPLCQLSYSQR